MANQHPQALTFPVVGIGASAGGVEALQVFFEALPESLGVAFVVIVHLDPNHHSELVSILARKTGMPVVEVTDSLALEANRVYVIPPDRRLQIADQKVTALPFEQTRGHRAPIDVFFRSLAEQCSDGFAVILSGSGTDGAVGVKAVKEQGGLILVQDPREAAFDGMPSAAIATGHADLVLPVRELAKRLAELVHHRQRVIASLVAAKEDKDTELPLAGILAHLHARTGHDFSKYKRTTVLRRIGRRMQVHRQETLGDYLLFLRQNAEEAQALFNELLISVTTFFRDPQAWDALREQVISKMLDEHEVEVPLRAWVPGCASGEEAYSLAILLLEEAEKRNLWPRIHIFATDLDEAALAIGREGRYPAVIEADVSNERLRRFFQKEDNVYRVNEEVRDCVLFASHNLLRDPPFSRLDLVSCRNLLIYLDRELQGQVFPIFRYALRPGGYLFLGASENADGDDFRTLDKTHHLFQARLNLRPTPNLPALLLGMQHSRTPLASPRTRLAPPVAYNLHRSILEELAPPSLLVDEQFNAVHLSETAGRFLQQPGGPLTRNITALVRPALQTEMNAGLHRAFKKGETSLSPFVPISLDGTHKRVALLVSPRRSKDPEHLALVVFLEGGEVTPIEPSMSEDEASSGRVSQLRDELADTQAQLHTSREDFESANEELRAANEELQSINEEYRSTAEELETSREELQSINEELQTVNSELKSKLDEVSQAKNDLENVMAATEIGTLFLDRALCIQRFTPQVSELFRITSGDRGRPITDFNRCLDYDLLETDAGAVLRELIPIEREARGQNGKWYLVRLRPYRTVNDRIDGVVVTFVDITALKKAQETLAQQTRQLQEQDRQKDAFLGMLSHELRNPLAAICNTVDLIRMQSPGLPEFEQRIDLIDRQLEHLLHLVDDLLNVTRIKRGTIAIKKTRLNIDTCVAEAVEQIRPQIEARHHRLETSLPRQPVPVQADPTRLTQIIVNLLSNAAQYTPNGGLITVTVTRADDQALVRVCDNGIGIDPEQLPHLFDPFKRLASDVSKNQAGLGLGLTLARQLTELHGGTLEGFSTGLGQGSEFTLRLPALSEALPNLSSPTTTDTDTAIPARRILLVEDDDAVAESLSLLLQHLGQKVRIVSRGGEVLKAIREFRPALVFLDIGLPDMSGQEVALRLRQESDLQSLRLIALTGHGHEENGQMVKMAGFDQVLLKPASVKTLKSILRTL